ncbi:MAG: hypothetical protein WCV79_03900 [Candidatus Paceibacterota bacterium]
MLDTFSLFGWRSFFRGEIDVLMSINLAVRWGFDGIVVYVRLFYKGIRDSAIAKSLPLVFDYQSQICQSLGFTDLGWVAKEKDVLYKIVSEEWLICKNNVRAIYLSDFSPRLGPERGMSLELGKGIFPIRDFVQLVKRTGWTNGYVVPVVKPNLSRFKRKEYDDLAGRLSLKVRQLFA